MSDVAFDFDRALALARQLHELSRWLDQAWPDRRTAADAAQAPWRGPSGDQFRQRAAADDDEAQRLAAALHVEALDWAQTWADAVNEQNRRAHDRRVAEIAAGRNWAERAVDLLTADHPDEHVAPLVPVTSPAAPDFLPAGGLQRF